MEKVIKFIKKKSLIQEGDFVVAGVSGGADSVYLLLVLCRLRKEMKIDILAVHVNHQIRQEAYEDQHFVETLCRNLNVPCRVVSEDVAARAGRRKMTLEEAGREARYEAFYKELKGKKNGKIAVAHHQNDQAETFLFRIARGTGLEGAKAMRPDDFPVVRPLLCMEKQEIKDELEKTGQTWVEDASNEDTAYARNQIRHYVVPPLEKVNEKAVKHIASLTEDLQEAGAFLEEEIKKAFQEAVTRQDGRRIIDTGILKEKHLWIQKQVIKKTLEETAGRKKDIEKRHILQVLDLAQGETGRQISLPYKITAEKSYQFLFLYQKGKEEEKGVKGRLIQEKMKDFLNISEKDCIKIIDYDRIEKGIQLRCRQPGDYFTFGPREKKKSLNRYFIDEKVPRHLRDRIPLAADGSHIVWIIGRRVSSHYEVSDATRHYLKLEFKGEGDEVHAENQGVDLRGESKSEDC